MLEAFRPSHRARQTPAVGLAILSLLSGPVFARINWVSKSSTMGDLPAPNEGNEQTCCVVCDIDRDGVDDFVVGERTKAPSVVWYKYNGKGWDKRVIDAGLLHPEAGGDAYDIDKDGDLDILLKPYHHRAPRIDILLNAGPLKASSGPG